MTAEDSISALLSGDRLGEAVERVAADLRLRPQDLPARLTLVDLLCLQGEYERADRQAETASRLHPEQAVGLALLRGRVRGMDARQAWFSQGAVPSFPGGPTTCDEIALRLGLALREGEDAASLLEELERARGTRPASWNGEAADDLRDLDDRLPHALEAITDGGAYLWIDLARIRSVEFAAPRRPLDLAFRRARLELVDGSIADVLVPAIYPGSDTSDALRLGRATEWIDETGGLVTGRGQRSFLVGDEVRGIAEASRLAFDGAGDG